VEDNTYLFEVPRDLFPEPWMYHHHPNPPLPDDDEPMPLPELEEHAPNNPTFDEFALPSCLMNAEDMVNALEMDNNDSLDLDKDELDILEAAKDTGKRAKKTERKIQSLLLRWFDTLRSHGSNILSHLLVVTKADYSGGRNNAFYNILGGEKSHAKTIVLNKCAILCGMKWLCLNGPNKGSPLSPRSFTKYMGVIFHEF
jgi:hypothetical protein